MQDSRTQRPGVLFIGLGGAVATTTITGVLALLQDLVPARGSITLSADCDGLDLVPLAELRFGGWDLDPTPLPERARAHRVVPADILSRVVTELSSIRVMPAVR